jgi:polyisoprenyl-phosphate glycosyltransferase
MLLSIIVPLFNEEEVLPSLVSRLDASMASLDCAVEVILVDDGSRDRTLEAATAVAERDPRYRVLSFTRNFGHQLALTAGLDFAQGDAALLMDGDLQDPPELIGRMLGFYRQGYDVVSAQRARRDGDARWKRACISVFYWVMRKAVDQPITPEVGDFRLFSRRAVLALRRFREQHRFMRGLIAWLGLREMIVPYERSERAAGTTKYPFWKLVAFAWTAVTSFSALPLRLTILFGLGLSGLGAAYFCYAAYQTLVAGSIRWGSGWASLVFLQVFFSGAILLAIGLIGEYLARVYDESKHRPLYVLQRTANIPVIPDNLERVLVLSPRDLPPK